MRGSVRAALGVMFVAAMLATQAALAGEAVGVLRPLLDAYWAAELDLHPLQALAQNEPSARERFDESLEDGWLVRMRAHLRETDAALAHIDVPGLSATDRVSYRMLRYQVDTARRYYDGDLYGIARRLPIDQFQGLHAVYAADAAGAGASPFRTVGDYDAALVRADAFARWVDDAIGRLAEGVRTGVVLPRLVVERILPQLSVHFGQDPERSEFWAPILRMPTDFSDDDRERIIAAYRNKISQVIQPAYERLYDYLRTDYLPHARPSAGLVQMPGGAKLYRYLVAFHTTTGGSASSIHARGLSEVRRISREMADVRAKLGYQGSERAFFDAVRANGAQHFGAEADVLPAYDAARRRILPLLDTLFDRLPKAPFEVRALPESSRTSQGNGYYAAAAADGTRPGILWINVYASGVRDRFNVMTISLHEGLPGHHLQTSLAQERSDLPAFRRFDETTAYVEGWGLYAESLGSYIGVYDDPWQYYGHLNYEMLRANRLVVDTGIHALGWSVGRAVRFMVDHSSMSVEQATAEVERYVAYPGQALAYKVGELKILELRDRARAQLGSRFDLRRFHDAVLLEGSLPLSILEQNVDDWIGRESTAQPLPSL